MRVHITFDLNGLVRFCGTLGRFDAAVGRYFLELAPKERYIEDYVPGKIKVTCPSTGVHQLFVGSKVLTIEPNADIKTAGYRFYEMIPMGRYF